MIQRTFITVLIMVATVSVGTAGIITKGTSGCRTEPVVPVIEQNSVDAYNKSVKAINEWQQKANTYIPV
jgi:hypothetical protein